MARGDQVAADYQIAIARARTATRVSTRPTLTGTATLGADALGTYGLPPDQRRVAASWGVGLTLAWQLYDGAARLPKSQIRQLPVTEAARL